ncbi:WxcM-like domain-containing protein [Halobacteriovorax sp. GB3]|uniref:WxcM-like domain-containing protein n=1 Tax=Halobacteriovorax sp. GB3 TaxID=2719615 RepID=UPI002362B2EC|nr:WxcM-like domain-containing protein [Halobacteriovorax sp. GB3]MDD0852549.1 WxcM-like domain-containing protein [Halobacteriovorax sp. GB3]
MNYFTHERAICESKNIGNNTRIWANAHVLPEAVIGSDCNICDGVFIENDVVVGNNVTIKCGVQLWDGIKVEDDVFIGPNATFTNDKHPRSKVYPESFLKTIVEKGASIGANATILPGVTIGQYAMIGAGAVVTKNIPPFAIVTGNPGRITDYIHDSEANEMTGVRLVSFKEISDRRGSLVFGEFDKQEIPFPVKRFFTIYDVRNGYSRGDHAHKECHQFIMCQRGSVEIVCDNGKERKKFVIDKPYLGIHVEPGVWTSLFNFSLDSTVNVFTSHYYDEDDYLRNYDLFKEHIQ